jgi:hypothetical protein
MEGAALWLISLKAMVGTRLKNLATTVRKVVSLRDGEFTLPMNLLGP